MYYIYYIYHIYHIYYYIYRYTHVITSREFQSKQTWRLTKVMAEIKLDTEQTMKME